MMMRIWCESLLAMALLVNCCGVPLQAQQPGPAVSSQEAERQRILQSDRWRQAERGLNEWLSVQKLYTPTEVSVLRSQFRSRIDRMSPAELTNQLDELEAKLAVLSSPDANEARQWLAQFLSVQAKYSDAQLRQMRPDIAHMTASQIRRELELFQQRRGAARQSQAAVQQGRSLQVQNAQNVQATRQQAAEQARQSATRAAVANQARINNPPRTDLPGHSIPPVGVGPAFTVGPWGNPILWDPRVVYW